MANQAAKAGGTLAGMWVLDVSDPQRVSKARSLEDLQLSFFDTSAPESRGVRFGAHNLHPNFPGPLYRQLENTTVATWFNGGIRIYRAVEARRV